MAKAINAGLRAALRADDQVLLMGEDIGPLGGVFRVTEGLQAEFGDSACSTPRSPSRASSAPRSGSRCAGSGRCARSSSTGSSSPAFDQITSQLAKITNRHEGALPMPVVIRIPYGGHIGAVEHHQESPEAYFAHTPGLRVVSPSTPERRVLDDPGGDRLATTR